MNAYNRGSAYNKQTIQQIQAVTVNLSTALNFWEVNKEVACI